MDARLTDVVGLFALLVVLAAAVAIASAARQKTHDTFVGFWTPPPARKVCGIGSAMTEKVCDGNANVARRLFFHDATMTTTPLFDTDGTTLGKTGNNSDPYYMQKLTPSANESSLRLTINDDADDSFQIWGNACGTTGCGGEGVQQHKFRADGSASHAGSLVLGAPGTATDYSSTSGSYPLGGALNIYNRDTDTWTHFPDIDGNNYIRNDTQVDGTFMVTKGDGDWNWVHVAGNHSDNLYLGSDGTNRGIWADGGRDFSIYNLNRPGLNIKTDGTLEVPGSTTHLKSASHTTACDGRMHLSSGEQLHLLPNDGVVVSKKQGGNGSISVEGDATVGGKFCIGSTCISESDLVSMLNVDALENALSAQARTLAAQEKVLQTQVVAAQSAQATYHAQFVAAAAANATALANAKAQSEDSNRQDAASRLTTQSLAQAQEQAQATANKIDNAVQASSRNAVNDLGPYNMGPWNAWNFQDQSARWIWNEQGAAGDAATGVCISFQKVFSSPWTVTGTVHIICDNLATVYFNGEYVGRGDGGWGGGNYSKLQVHIESGANVLRVEARNQGGPASLLASVIANGSVLARTERTWTWAQSCPNGGP